MAWMDAKHFNELKKHFSVIIDNKTDLEIINEVLDMDIHNENAGEYMYNLRSDMEDRGISIAAKEVFDGFASEWEKSVKYHFKYTSPDYNFQDFLDNIHVN